MKTLKAKVNSTPLNNKDDKIIIKMEDFNDDDDDEEEDHHKKSNDNLSSSNESGFGTVDELNSIESDNSLKEHKDTIAVLNLNNNPLTNPIQLFQQSQLNNAFQIDQPCSAVVGQQPQQQIIKQTQNNLYDDHLVILNTSTHSSATTLSSTFSRRIQENKILRYLCFCCTCCKTTNTIFWSWLSIFCCCCPLLGLFSLYFTYKSKKYKLKQKYELSDKYSNYAEKLNIASLIFGILFYAVAFFIITLVLFMYWRHSYA